MFWSWSKEVAQSTVERVASDGSGNSSSTATRRGGKVQRPCLGGLVVVMLPKVGSNRCHFEANKESERESHSVMSDSL